MSRPKKIFFDGGCRPNPGVIEIAVVAGGVAHILRDHGHGSCMDAEWLALIYAAQIARTLGDCVLLGDAAAVIDQANGTVRCRGANMAHRDAFRTVAGGTRPRIRYIKRTQNLAGIALAKVRR